MKEKLDIEQARNIWNEPAPEIDTDKLNREFEHIHGKIRQTRIRMIVRGSAACLIAALLLGTGLYLQHNHTEGINDIPEYVEYVANTGEIKNVSLPDGSTVFLNSQSRLFCASSFDKSDTRDVFLCGEALFEVSKNPEQPFIVHAGGNSIKVTGTKFNVRAFMDEDICTTSLIEGSVEVSVPGHSNPFVLTPGKALSVSEKNSISLFDIEASTAIGWHKGIFNAYHKTLDQICRDLERRFDVKIMISNEDIASKMFYASFVNNESVENILNALNVQKDFRLKIQDKYYFIY